MKQTNKNETKGNELDRVLGQIHDDLFELQRVRVDPERIIRHYGELNVGPGARREHSGDRFEDVVQDRNSRRLKDNLSLQEFVQVEDGGEELFDELDTRADHAKVAVDLVENFGWNEGSDFFEDVLDESEARDCDRERIPHFVGLFVEYRR